MTQECITPLRRRMIEDMTVRHFASETQRNYIRAVMKLARFLGRSPDTATNEDLRRFQLHLTENHAGAPIINSTVSALRFFFTVTLDRANAARRLTFVHEPRKLPVVLSPEEVARLRAASYYRESGLVQCSSPVIVLGSLIRTGPPFATWRGTPKQTPARTAKMVRTI